MVRVRLKFIHTTQTHTLYSTSKNSNVVFLLRQQCCQWITKTCWFEGMAFQMHLMCCHQLQHVSNFFVCFMNNDQKQNNTILTSYQHLKIIVSMWVNVFVLLWSAEFGLFTGYKTLPTKLQWKTAGSKIFGLHTAFMSVSELPKPNMKHS